MNQLSVFIIVIFLFLHVKAQNSSKPHFLNLLRPSLAVVIGVVSVMFSIVLLLLAYAKFCHTIAPGLFNHNVHDQNIHGLVRSRSRFSGIDKTVIELLPFFRFSSLEGSKDGLECAVCLSKFEDSEILRLLPKCKHAFHINCIDQWLESHSSCPLCRHKFDARDLTSFTYSNSMRFTRNPSSNLTEDPNLQLFVQREQDHQGSSRFSIGSSFQKIDKGKKEEFLIQEGNNSDGDWKLLHKFKHKIIVSDVVLKNRWSDVNSSDLMFLNSEMLNVMSSKRLSSLYSNSERFHTGFPMNEQIIKIKEDIERKRLYESKYSKMYRSHSVSTSSFPSTSNSEANLSATSRILNPTGKRSMSEITNLSRFTEFRMKESSPGESTNGKEDRMRRIWLPMARRTVQWFAGRERISQEPAESKRHPSNV